jgi:hypothetical protein
MDTDVILNLPNIGIPLLKIPDNIFDIIKKEVEVVKTNIDQYESAASVLAGNIDKELFVNNLKEPLKSFVLNISEKYIKSFLYPKNLACIDNVKEKLDIDSVWLNFQKKGDFNPTHNHYGIFSFVIWINIPYNIDDEKKVSPGRNSNKDAAGCFEIMYTDIIGTIKTYSFPVEKNMEGHILFFPACIQHSVYPFFSSDEYRISLAGNVKSI